MTTAKISKRSVDAIQPVDKDSYLWDSDLSGFGVKVTPKGRRTYLIQYRLGGRKGRTRRVTIGQHGMLTAEQARTIAKRLLGELAAGQDPAAQRDRAKTENTMGEVLDRFLAEHVGTKLKSSTSRDYRRSVRLYIRPKFRHRLITDIKRSDIASLHHSMQDKPYQANRTLAVLSKVFNWCEKHGLRPDGTNPCRHIEKFPEKKRERFLSEQELARLGEVLVIADRDDDESPWVVGAIQLLVLTGARLNEILTLKWDYADFERAILRLPDSKTGAKTIYLNAPALEVFANIPRIEGNPFVVCGKKTGVHLVNLQKPWRRIRAKAGLEDVRLHDLRHTFASYGAMGGVSLPIIGGLVGHSQPQTTARYAHLSADPLMAASNAIAGRIAGAMIQSNEAKIVELSSAKKKM